MSQPKTPNPSTTDAPQTPEPRTPRHNAFWTLPKRPAVSWRDEALALAERGKALELGLQLEIIRLRELVDNIDHELTKEKANTERHARSVQASYERSLQGERDSHKFTHQVWQAKYNRLAEAFAKAMMLAGQGQE